MAQSKKYWAMSGWWVLTLLLGVSISTAQDINPADPTAALTSLVFEPEYNKADDYNASLFRVTYDKDWAGGTYSVTVGVAVGTVDFKDGSNASGLGDTRTRFFWKVYDKPDGTLESAIFNLDVFAPTGKASEGLGMGTFVVVPSVILGFPISEQFAIYPMPKVKFSTGKTQGRTSAFPPGGNPIRPRLESEEYVFGLELETPFVFDVPKLAAWALLAPVIDWDLLPEPGEDNYEVTLKGEVGKMVGRIGIGAEVTIYVAGERSQDFQAKFLAYYYF